MNIWLVGAGSMAVEYAKVLDALGKKYVVIGRGAESAAHFESVTGRRVRVGGVEQALTLGEQPPECAIVSVGVESLAETSTLLVRSGVRRILVEKPGGLDTNSITDLARAVQDARATVFVAYNRRFYAATLHALEIIKEDGGLVSCNFEFTEWGHEIESLRKAPGVKDRWFLANSTHVVDLAFYLAGTPSQMTCYTSGSLSWHPSAAAFSGAGITNRGAVFSYQANWGAPGRWAVEALTADNRLIFRPMEILQVMRKGKVAIEPLVINDSLDRSFKPGLYRQVERFLSGEYDGLCSLAEHVSLWPRYCEMAGYLST